MSQAPLERMAEHLPALNGAHRQLALWYLRVFGSGEPMPLDHNCNDIAKAVGVSRATVIRFARALGYSGFASLRNALYHYAGSVGSRAAGDQVVNGQLESLAHVTALHSAALASFLHSVDGASFEQGVQWLSRATFVLWIGWGDSYFIAASGEHKCRLAGFAARSANDVADLGLHVTALPADAVIVVVSQSGRWQAIADALDMARKRGIRVISLTGQAGSLLSSNADLSFLTVNPTFRVAGHPFTLRSAQTALVDALILEAARRAGNSTVEPPEVKQLHGLQQYLPYKVEA